MSTESSARGPDSSAVGSFIDCSDAAADVEGDIALEMGSRTVPFIPCGDNVREQTIGKEKRRVKEVSHRGEAG